MMALQLHRYLEPLERLMIRVAPPKKKPPVGLVEAAEDAKRTWKQALNQLNFVDRGFVDYAVHNINAAERRYVALVLQAKKEGLTAWDYSALAEPANKETEELTGSPVRDQAKPRTAISPLSRNIG